MQFQITLTEVTNSIQNTLIDQIPQDAHRINVFQNWDERVGEAEFDERLQSLNIQGLKGKLLKNIRKHQLSLIEENDDDIDEDMDRDEYRDDEVPLVAMDE
jgi:hypothetical protein